MTVASVGPYVLTTRLPGRHQRFTNSGGHASPPRISNRRLGISSSIIASNVGTQERTVTPNSLSIRGSSGPAWTISSVAATKVAAE